MHQSPKILESWKEISDFIGRSIKTCQRYEREYDLPVHRLDGSPKARVYAYPEELEEWRESILHQEHKPGPEPSPPSRGRRRLLALAALLIVSAAAVGIVSFRREWSVRRARTLWIPRIMNLIENEEYTDAFYLAKEAREVIPGHPDLENLIDGSSRPLSVRTDPPDAEVFIRDYSDSGAEWIAVGRTPFSGRTIPRSPMRWKIVMSGFVTREGSELRYDGNLYHRPFPLDIDLILTEPEKTPAGMIRVPAGLWIRSDIEENNLRLILSGLRHAPPVTFEDFWLDRCEVTNREFTAFVVAGGYRNRSLWKHPFVQEGKTLTWAEAMAEFVDRTGYPGPSTWENGACPAGREDHPVAGVSWYEAAAYAEFAEKSLPTVYHWEYAAGLPAAPLIIPLSHFGPEGTVPAGASPAIGPFGHRDMAGNVKEWCRNACGGKRFTLGGGWGEPSYQFYYADAMPPMSRGGKQGFRCARYPSEDEGASATPIPPPKARDFDRERPVDDAAFQVLAQVYAYERTPLQAEIVERDTTSELWIREKILFNAAYLNERMIAHLFLPRDAVPPFQTVIWFPGGGALNYRNIEDYQDPREEILRGGRAFLYPIFKSTFERGSPDKKIPSRDLVIMLYRDLARSIDYLETRADIDSGRLAYLGFSWGGHLAPIFLSMEKRIRAAVVAGVGFYPDRYPPVCDQLNFITRMTTPVLMMNGRYDFLVPPTRQEPFFRLLGTPPEHKRRLLLEGGHTLPVRERIRATNAWLDRYLGPVTFKSREGR